MVPDVAVSPLVTGWHSGVVVAVWASTVVTVSSAAVVTDSAVVVPTLAVVPTVVVVRTSALVVPTLTLVADVLVPAVEVSGPVVVPTTTKHQNILYRCSFYSMKYLQHCRLDVAFTPVLINVCTTVGC